ncbi:MAG: DUF6290 family protein [Bacteroides sp.]
MTISLRLDEQDTKLIKSYAELNKVTVSELIRRIVLEKIEDEYDLKEYTKALAEYRENPVTYTLDEVEAELGLR